MSSKVLGMLALLFLAFSASRAAAQQCPNSEPGAAPEHVAQEQRLKGRLIYHDGLRHWYELQLDQAKCGQRSIQLTAPDNGWKSLEKFRGCNVASIGKIDFSPTGYYSLDLYQYVAKIQPVGACALRPPIADFSTAKPSKHVRAYRVDMRIDYRSGDHPVVFRIRNGDRELRPWQAYASYQLTGGYVLYGLCGEGFVIDKVFGTRAARPSHFTESRDSGDMAAFDPETAAQSGSWDLNLGYTCVRR